MSSIPHANGAVVPIPGGRNETRASATDLRQILDDAFHLLASQQICKGMQRLMSGLSEVRNRFGPQHWEALFCAEAINHPVSQLIWQDPFTAHSFRRPRGYPGDASLLDYIYGYKALPPETSSLGAAIFEFNRDRQAPRSVRARAQVLAAAIDQTSDRVPSPRILSVACGHLREAALSNALAEGRIGEFFAVDQDEESLRHVDRDFGAMGVQTIRGSVRCILAEKVRFDNLDLVYAAGLFDYLSDRVAARLTRMLFDMLAPHGQLLVANFAPCLGDIAYIESYMAWKLIYREPEQLAALAQEISSNDWSSHRLFWDEHESIVFLELKKRQQINGAIHFGPGLRRAAVPGLNRISTPPRVADEVRLAASRFSSAEGRVNGNGNGNGNGK